jgi:outer membrane protein TolC
VPRADALLAAALLLAAPAGAAVVTWEDVAARAAAGNPDLASSRLTRDARRASYWSSYNRVLPSLSLSNSVSESNTARQPAWSASASASLTLFDLGDYAAIRSASASLGAAEASLRGASADLRSSLRRAFSSLLFAQTGLDVARRVLDVRGKNAELVRLRYESGRESKGNMLRAAAQRVQAEVLVASSERDLRVAQRELARRLGSEDFEPFVASGTCSAAPAPALPGDFRALLSLRPDIASAEASLRSADAALASARSSLFPRLSADYSRTRSGSTEFPSRRYSWSAGATLSYPLFGGGPTEAWLSNVAAKRSREASRRDLDAARQAALSDLESAWSDYATASDQVRVQEALLAAARQRNDEADVRYASGLLSYDVWEPIVSDRVSSERSAVSARRAAMDAETAWDRALGRALGE